MKLNELKILIETNQIKEICFHAQSLKQEYIFTVLVISNNVKYSGKLQTGRTSQDKTYSSIDRAFKAMVNLGYKGEYKILVEGLNNV